jgi:hypothetical protein
MITKTDVFNSYRVQFVFDFTVISTTVFAMHEDACRVLAIDLIKSDTGMPEDVFEDVHEVIVELLDRDVL